jgi:hypothetical protein
MHWRVLHAYRFPLIHGSEAVSLRYFLFEKSAAVSDLRHVVIFRYLTLVESLPTYGVHYYEVKVSGPLCLFRGI